MDYKKNTISHQTSASSFELDTFGPKLPLLDFKFGLCIFGVFSFFLELKVKFFNLKHLKLMATISV